MGREQLDEDEDECLPPDLVMFAKAAYTRFEHQQEQETLEAKRAVNAVTTLDIPQKSAGGLEGNREVGGKEKGKEKGWIDTIPTSNAKDENALPSPPLETETAEADADAGEVGWRVRWDELVGGLKG